MKQISFADAEYAGKRKQTRRERFLIEMDQVVPWKGLVTLIEPYYPKGEGGRPAYPLMAMLRVHLMQNWFGYSDPAMEESLYETTILRQFAGLHLDRIPDETTILNFRRLLENMSWLPGFCRSSMAIWATVVCCYARGRWSMQRSFMRRVRPRTRTVNVIQKCTRRRKEINISSE
jgi:IS5 family transposase